MGSRPRLIIESNSVRVTSGMIGNNLSQLGALALPMPVGANGGIFFSSFLVNF